MKVSPYLTLKQIKKLVKEEVTIQTNTLLQDMYNLLFPLNSIQLFSHDPNLTNIEGVNFQWEEITTSEGMAVLFGGSSDTPAEVSGNIKEHKHIEGSYIGTNETNFSKYGTSAVGSSGSRREGDSAASGLSAFTSSVGVTNNEAWGLKVGLKIWKRIL